MSVLKLLAVVLCATVMTAVACAAPIFEDATVREYIMQSTTNQKSHAHIVFEERVVSKKQSDWTNSFNARVTLYIGGKAFANVTGSTLPNNMKEQDDTFVFSLLRSSCNLLGITNRYYTWKVSTFVSAAGKTNRCLRLHAITPSAVISTARKNDEIVWGTPTISKHYAENILVHAGRARPRFDGDRGSDGCLTVVEWSSLLGAISTNKWGTLEVLRTFVATNGVPSCF